MLQTIIAGLILAAVSGLTYLAYKHPKGYDLIFNYLFTVTVVVFLLYGTYKTGYAEGYSNGLYADKSKWLDDSWFLWWVSGWWASMAFLVFLKILPTITSDTRKDDADKDKPPKRKKP